MEDIEYLEEYEDVVLPFINIHSARGERITIEVVQPTDTTITSDVATVNDEMSIKTDSSSSLDQDVFNCLFNDHSDDDNETKGDEVGKQTSITKSTSSCDAHTSVSEHNSFSLGSLYATANDVTASKLTTVTTKSASISNINTSHSNMPIVQTTKQGELKNLTVSSGSYHVNRTVQSSTAPENRMNEEPLTTIIRPERIVGADSITDPLNLDDDNLSVVVSDLLSISDISDHTIHNFSDFNDDDTSYDLETMYEIPSSTLPKSRGTSLSCETINTNQNDHFKLAMSTANEEVLTKGDNNLQLLNMFNERCNDYDELKELKNYKHQRHTSYDIGLNNINSTSDSNNVGATSAISATTALNTLAHMGSFPDKPFVINDTILTPYNVQKPFTDSLRTATITTPIATTNNLPNANSTCIVSQTTNAILHMPGASNPITIIIKPMGKPSLPGQLNDNHIISPSALTNDSYLSAVDEMLDEAYAVAMLKKEEEQQISHIQDIGAEVEVDYVDNFINMDDNQNKLILEEQFQQSVDILGGKCELNKLLFQEQRQQQPEQSEVSDSLLHHSPLSNILGKSELTEATVLLQTQKPISKINNEIAMFEQQQQLMSVNKIEYPEVLHTKKLDDDKPEDAGQNQKLQEQYREQPKQQLCEAAFEREKTVNGVKQNCNKSQSNMMQSTSNIRDYNILNNDEINPMDNKDRREIIHQGKDSKTPNDLKLITAAVATSSETKMVLKDSKNESITNTAKNKTNIAAYKCNKTIEKETNALENQLVTVRTMNEIELVEDGKTTEKLDYAKSSKNNLNNKINAEDLNKETTENIIKDVAKELTTNDDNIENKGDCNKNAKLLDVKCVSWSTQSNIQNTLHSSSNNKKAVTNNKPNAEIGYTELDLVPEMSHLSKDAKVEMPLKSENITNANEYNKSESVLENGNVNIIEILSTETTFIKLEDEKDDKLTQEIIETTIDDNLNEDRLNNFTQHLATVASEIPTSISSQIFNIIEKKECFSDVVMTESSINPFDDDLNIFIGFDDSAENNDDSVNYIKESNAGTLETAEDSRRVINITESQPQNAKIDEHQQQQLETVKNLFESISVGANNKPKSNTLNGKKEADEKEVTREIPKELQVNISETNIKKLNLYDTTELCHSAASKHGTNPKNKNTCSAESKEKELLPKDSKTQIKCKSYSSLRDSELPNKHKGALSHRSLSNSKHMHEGKSSLKIENKLSKKICKDLNSSAAKAKLESENVEQDLRQHSPNEVLASKEVISPTVHAKPERIEQENIIAEESLLKGKGTPSIENDKGVGTPIKEHLMSCTIKSAGFLKEEKERLKADFNNETFRNVLDKSHPVKQNNEMVNTKFTETRTRLEILEIPEENLKHNDASISKYNKDSIFKESLQDNSKNLKIIPAIKEVLDIKCDIEEKINMSSLEQNEKQECASKDSDINGVDISTSERKENDEREDSPQLVKSNMEESIVEKNTKPFKQTSTEYSLLTSSEIPTTSQSDNSKCTTTTIESPVTRTLRKHGREFSVENEYSKKTFKEPMVPSSSIEAIEQDDNTRRSADISAVCTRRFQTLEKEQSAPASEIPKVLNIVPLISEKDINQTSGKNTVQILEDEKFKKTEQTKEQLYKKSQQLRITLGEALNKNIKDNRTDGTAINKYFPKINRNLEGQTKSPIVYTETKVKTLDKKHNNESTEATRAKSTFNSNVISFYEWQQMLRSEEQAIAPTTAPAKDVEESSGSKSKKKSDSKDFPLKNSGILQETHAKKGGMDKKISNNVKGKTTVQKKVTPTRGSHIKFTKNDNNCDATTHKTHKSQTHNKDISAPPKNVLEVPKMKNKRSETEILKESWSKTMKDSGIELLLNQSNVGKCVRRNRKRLHVNEIFKMEKPLHRTHNKGTFYDNHITADSDPIYGNTTSSANDNKDHTSNNAGCSTTMDKKENSDKVHVENMITFQLISSHTPYNMSALSKSATVRKDTISQRLNSRKRKLIKASSRRKFKKSEHLLHHNFHREIKMERLNAQSADIMKRNIGTTATSIAPETKQNIKEGLNCRELTIRLNRSFVPKYLRDKLRTEDYLTSRRGYKHASLTQSMNSFKESSATTHVRNLKKRNKAVPLILNGIQSTSTSHTKRTPTSTKSIKAADDFSAKMVSQPKNEINVKQDECILPATSTLTSRSQSIAIAAPSAINLALSNNDSSSRCKKNSTNTSLQTASSNYNRSSDHTYRTYRTPSFGVTSLLVEENTRLYHFLHPAKSEISHGDVALDHCYPNLDGPMPSINLTCIYGQMQTDSPIPSNIVKRKMSKRKKSKTSETNNLTKSDLHSSESSDDIQSYIQLIRLDGVLKKLAGPFDDLNLLDRKRLMELLLATSKFQAKDIEGMISLLEEYNKQIDLLKNLNLNAVTSSEPMSTSKENISPWMTNSTIQKYRIPIFNMDDATDNASLSLQATAAAKGSFISLVGNATEENNTTNQSYKDTNNSNTSSIERNIFRTRAGRIVKRTALESVNVLHNLKSMKTKSTTVTIKSMNKVLKPPISTVVSTPTTTNTSDILGRVASKNTKPKSGTITTASTSALTSPSTVCGKKLSVDNSNVLQRSYTTSTIPTSANYADAETATMQAMGTSQRLTRKRAGVSSKDVIVSKTKPKSDEPDNNR